MALTYLSVGRFWLFEDFLEPGVPSEVSASPSDAGYCA